MKYILSSLLSTLAVGMLAITPTTHAVTPDGLPPANEGVCDSLIGGTPGLYGLCVAFCEAQDQADLSAPITQEELNALENSRPSGRILANYNKRKQDVDPDMPCIKVEEPCPCWDAAEFDDATLSGIGALFCNRSDGPDIYGSAIQDWLNVFNNTLVYARNDASTGNSICILSNRLTNTFRNLDDISPDQFAACDTQIRQRQDELGISGSCFPGL